MNKINGLTIFHATRPGEAQPIRYTKKDKKISTKRLVKSYLCSGADSRCVLERQCECLDACMYGQQYIRNTGGKNE